MKKSDFKFQQNLAVREFTIPAGGEWSPRLTGWSLILVRQGTGYCLQPQVNRELVTGAVLLASGFLQGSIRASQLGELFLCSFNIIPERLTGLITLGEQNLLQLPATSEPLLKILPPDSPAAIKTSELFADKTRRGLLFRLKLLQLFAEFFLDEPRQVGFMETNADASDAMKRLQKFMQELPVSELLEMDFNELAKRTHCTSRHLSRIFCKLVGMSFTDKRAELRLEKARQLLATSNSKVVQVALESGYNSLSQFNLMFVRHYGMSPSKWRQKYGHASQRNHGKTVGHPVSQPGGRPAPFGAKPSLKLAFGRGGKGNIKLAHIGMAQRDDGNLKIAG
jgi:AraC-like DNA-binding protein